MPDEIVIFAEPVVEYLGGCWQASLPDAGHSVIARTQTQALGQLVELVAKSIREHREAGTLGEWLLAANLTAGYAEDFPHAKSRFRG